MHVTCVKGQYAELTKGNQYKVYGATAQGIVVRNDAGLLLTYANDYFF